MCVCVCVCVCERERENTKHIKLVIHNVYQFMYRSTRTHSVARVSSASRGGSLFGNT